ncbi:alpha/beta hydrolase [Amycolatopsis cynarae]|uniref:Alpha/beta hydrolase n=1 Tax=Amycolatopsis cynarae TaxID=2995223 RepID=A0ABY7B6E5_9PSEU|nr:alpha/beta hydrolase [Amycolatopsis sp. HUAS 11-8]WAL67731.1 alpha/beta hydrolase [Amycolatopsis sp. HUAS 11-8]
MRSTRLVPHIKGADVHRLTVSGRDLVVETAGHGPAVLLLHGFPHTRAVWRDVAPVLTRNGFSVIVPDLPGLGDSDPAAAGCGAPALAGVMAGLLDALHVHRAHVVGIDLGVTTAFALAAVRAERVISLVLSEGLVGELPGAEDFLRHGPPWWFGFHQAPGKLAEAVLVGNEERYLRHFLTGGSRRGLDDDLTQVIVAAYRGEDSLGNAFDHYRAMPSTARWISEWAAGNRLSAPVLAVGGGAVGEATARQLSGVSDHLTTHLLPQSGHIVPVDEPEVFADLITAHAGNHH